jgi:hypothetical protein
VKLSTRISGVPVRWIIAGALMLAAAMPAAGADSHEWEFGGEVYLWGAGFGMRTTTGDDIDVSFTDIAKKLKMAVMASLVASKDQWALFGDFIYLDLQGDDRSTASIVGFPQNTTVDAELQGVIATFGGAYRVFESDTTQLHFLAGARLLSLSVDLNYNVEGVKLKRSDSGSGWDGIVGMRGSTDLNDRWYLTYYLDVGTGDSELTWQALAGINYRFEKVDAVLGYRYLDWTFDNNDLLDDLNVSGPYAGIKFRF